MRCSCMQIGCLVGEIKTAKQRYLGTSKRSWVALLLFVIDLLIRVLFMKARCNLYAIKSLPAGDRCRELRVYYLFYSACNDKH